MSHWLSVVVTLVLLLSSTVHAQQSYDISITQTVSGTDTIAPSIPNNLTAVALSSSTVQLSWGSSIDNVGVAYYMVWRDSMQVATTAINNYIDSNLFADTSYQYYVTAVDAGGNQSASSTVVSVTTLPEVLAAERTIQQSISHARAVSVRNFNIVPQEQAVQITFSTDIPVRYRLTWNSVQGEGGEIVSSVPRQNQIISVPLEYAGTLYEFSLELFTREPFIRYQNQFTVQTLPSRNTAMPNVFNVEAVSQHNGVLLTWSLPNRRDDISHIRVVRQYDFYPIDTADGWVLLDSLATEVFDTTAIRPVYYTIFVVGKNGAVSSGAVIAVFPDGEISAPDSYIIEQNNLQPGVSTTTRESVTPVPTGWPIYVVQGSTVYDFSDGKTIVLASQRPFTIEIPSNNFPTYLTSLVATLSPSDAVGQVQRYLLKKNTTGDRYQATVASLSETGSYTLTISWYDFVTETYGEVEGMLFRTETTIVTEKELPIRPIMAGLLIIIVLYIVRIIYRYWSSDGV